MVDIDKFIDCIQRFLIPEGFTGFGLVIYRDQVEALPISPLSAIATPHMSGKISDTVRYIFELSKMSDPRHDGFHFLNEDLVLTNIAYYFAPPVHLCDIALVMDVGSRIRTAQLGSMMANVDLVVVMDKKRNLYLFEDGVMRTVA